MKQYQRRIKYQPGTQDDCQTPPYALTSELVDLFQNYLVWECASGEGYLVNALKSNGIHAVYSDLKTGVDFVYDDVSLYHEKCPYSAIITNPPYTNCIGFLEKCIQLEVPFALLMRAELLFTSKYWNVCHHYLVYPSIGIPSRRIDFKMPNAGWKGSAHFPTAWFVYHHELEPNKVYQWKVNKPKPSEVEELSKSW